MIHDLSVTLCSLDRLRGMVDVYNYYIRVVNILTFIYLFIYFEGKIDENQSDLPGTRARVDEIVLQERYLVVDGNGETSFCSNLLYRQSLVYSTNIFRMRV